ncbi:TRAP transporter substrate-binding protein [Psychrosphaera sp. B3R10]|uniref:TRAP transporter substrate-binding protein n=1 Tax=unclassified Psychrosphaera TaxID=2641570 RepID=UPI001C09A5D7|nr:MULTISPECIES: TRAP transporter substrate-binding protein [unclassified Psychrosphaera]MBU2881685.1 TRAP transporter substrate-binding protein [Psychrosphaera sp. I2R16]MBU2991060.1 TRAP transporter substrate-binding protein [Psychrosphaera sp. B3R10]MDO6718771.1 TRAP transporter substrate-binding protein [Psychrosphaera sp. 1_MG-2023]
MRILIIIIAMFTLASCGEKQGKTRLTLGHTLDTRHVVHLAMEYMGERLQHYSDGQMELVIYPGGQLGSEREMIELLQIGSLSMTKVSASPLEGFVPEMKLFSIPYLIRDREHFWRVLDGEIGQSLLDKTAIARLKGMGYYDAGSRSFYTSDAPIRKPDDLLGKKIRVLNSPTAMAMVKALGGAAAPIAWGELYAALQQGVVDGAENNPPSYYLSRHYEIAKYYSLDEHTFVPDIILASLPVWQSLSMEQQGWLSQAMRDSIEYQKSLWQKASDDALAAVIKAGVEVVYPDKVAFQQKVAPFHATFDNSPVAEQIKKIKKM